MVEQPVFLRTRDILKLLGIKRSTWNNWVKTGKAPAGLKLSSRTFIWKQVDIDAFLEAARKHGTPLPVQEPAQQEVQS
ncbi:MAG: helix-turn-helix domain-containing protein [Erysipelotrichia bacterium]|nr:helix-turn-helix domain-containing protein [Erysipelotrichia bacterium]